MKFAIGYYPTIQPKKTHRALHALANFAKRLECVQLAGAFGPPTVLESGSKLHALHTLANLAKRLECVQLAGALRPPTVLESGSKLHALQTLRALHPVDLPSLAVVRRWKRRRPCCRSATPRRIS